MSFDTERPINVGLLGLGNVGVGVANCFLEGRFTSDNIFLTAVCVKDLTKRRDVKLPKTIKLTDDPYSVTDDPSIDILVELIGGTNPAKAYSIKALKKGKHLVTGNKELLGKYLPDLLDLARESGVSLNFEASVCGAIPVIQNLRDYLRLQKVTSIKGVLNGTTNYILTRMEDGMDFDPALEEAQGLGIAETNHILDTGGYDTRSKLAILASLASGKHIRPESIPCHGITEVRLEDIAFGREFRNGYAIKLLASAEQHDGAWSIQVSPALINRNNPLSSIRGKLNSITLEGDLSGPLTFTGFGASRNPTAGAVIADILHAAEHIRFKTPDFLPRLNRNATITKSEEISSTGYIRGEFLDVPKTLGTIGNLLGNQGLNIGSFLQREEPHDVNGLPYKKAIITLSKAVQSQIDAGLKVLTKSGKVHGPLFYMPIVD